MSVLIKGMQMPKNCMHCGFSHMAFYSLKMWIVCKPKDISVTTGDAVKDGRPDWCPLIEVPSADIAEVRHGEWEENKRTSISERHREIHYNIYKCSRCNHANGKHKSNFCPNCGATMDKERL